MENKGIHKYKSWDEVPDNHLEFWLKKTPSERLEAAKELNNLARLIYNSNKNNIPLFNGRRIRKFHSIAERS